MKRWFANLSTGRKVALAGLGLLALVVIVGVAAPKQPANNEYKPQNEFKLDPWIHIKIGSLDLSINKGVLYLFIACALTTFTLVTTNQGEE